MIVSKLWGSSKCDMKREALVGFTALTVKLWGSFCEYLLCGPGPMQLGSQSRESD